jgi:hypothetical protein
VIQQFEREARGLLSSDIHGDRERETIDQKLEGLRRLIGVTAEDHGPPSVLFKDPHIRALSSWKAEWHLCSWWQM